MAFWCATLSAAIYALSRSSLVVGGGCLGGNRDSGHVEGSISSSDESDSESESESESSQEAAKENSD